MMVISPLPTIGIETPATPSQNYYNSLIGVFVLCSGRLLGPRAPLHAHTHTHTCSHTHPIRPDLKTANLIFLGYVSNDFIFVLPWAVRSHIHTHARAHKHIYIHAQHEHMRVRTHMHTHIHTCALSRTHMYTHKRTFTHAYRTIRTHTQEREN